MSQFLNVGELWKNIRSPHRGSWGGLPDFGITEFIKPVQAAEPQYRQPPKKITETPPPQISPSGANQPRWQPAPQVSTQSQQPQPTVFQGESELGQLSKMDRNPVQETRYQELLKQQGQQAGGVPNAEEYYRQKAEEEAQRKRETIAQYENPVREAMAQLVQAMQGQQTPLDVYKQMYGELNIPKIESTTKGLRDQVSQIEELLQNIAPSVQARTRQSLITEAQRQRMQTAEETPLRSQLAQLMKSLGTSEESLRSARGEVGRRVELGLKGQEQKLAPYKTQIEGGIQSMKAFGMPELNVIADKYATQITGFDKNRQAMLQALRDKLAREQDLNDREWSQAQQLAKEERDWNRTKEEVAMKSQYRKPTEAEQSKPVKQELLADAAGGAQMKDLMKKYGNRLSVEEILKLYTSVSPYGAPKEDWAKQMMGLGTAQGGLSDQLYGNY